MDLLSILFLTSAILSVVVAWAASQKNRSPVGWFFLSLLISPLFALLVLLVVGPATGGPNLYPQSSQGGQRRSRLNDADLDAIRRHQANQPTHNTDPLGLGTPTVTVLRADGQQYSYSVLQLQDAYKAGDLQPAEHYWDPQAEQWLELSAHPRLS